MASNNSLFLLCVVLASLLLISQDVAAARDHFTDPNESEGKNMKPAGGAGLNDEKLVHVYYGSGGGGSGYGGGYGSGYGGYVPGHGWYGGGYGHPGYGGGYGGSYGGYGGGGGYGGYGGGGGYGGYGGSGYVRGGGYGGGGYDGGWH